MTDSARPCAYTDLPFPRPEPEYNAKRMRDLAPFAIALAQLTDARRTELAAQRVVSHAFEQAVHAWRTPELVAVRHLLGAISLHP